MREIREVSGDVGTEGDRRELARIGPGHPIVISDGEPDQDGKRDSGTAHAPPGSSLLTARRTRREILAATIGGLAAGLLAPAISRAQQGELTTAPRRILVLGAGMAGLTAA